MLACYASAIAAISVFGGWLPSAVRMTHTRTQVAMSFVAGLLLGVAIYQLLPSGFAQLGGPQAMETAIWWMMLGVVFMVLLLRVFRFHQHDFSGNGQDARHPQHDNALACSSAAARAPRWIGVTCGLGIHSLVEGIALGTAVKAADDGSALGLAGSGAFLAIFSHKPLDALSIAITMRTAGVRRSARLVANGLFALLCPAAAALTFWGVGLLGAGQDAFMGRALALSAGAFLCISLSDLLPELQFHSHDRGKLAVCFVAGIVLAYALHLLEAQAPHHH